MIDTLSLRSAIQSDVRELEMTGSCEDAPQTDGEPAVVQLQEQIVAQREHKTISQNPPAHDPQANGEAERAVQEVEAQLRTTKLGLEARVGVEIHVVRTILEWMIRHAVQTGPKKLKLIFGIQNLILKFFCFSFFF